MRVRELDDQAFLPRDEAQRAVGRQSTRRQYQRAAWARSTAVQSTGAQPQEKTREVRDACWLDHRPRQLTHTRLLFTVKVLSLFVQGGQCGMGVTA